MRLPQTLKLSTDLHWRINYIQCCVPLNGITMNKVHIILELKSEDYHGTYKEIVAVYGNEEDCKSKLKELEEENHYYNIEYWHEVFNVL